MAKRIDVLASASQTVEAVPHGNTYPTGAITITETATTCGDLKVYSKTDVSDSFDIDGRADIYVNGFFQKTIFFAPELSLGKDWDV